MSAQAHCDAVDGPVAMAAVKALDTRNVNLVVPFAPAQAEPESRALSSRRLRGGGTGTKALADRYYGDRSPAPPRRRRSALYRLRAGRDDFGPAIPAAEKALETDNADDLTALMAEQVAHGIADRFRDTMAHSAATKEPAKAADVAAAVSA